MKRQIRRKVDNDLQKNQPRVRVATLDFAPVDWLPIALAALIFLLLSACNYTVPVDQVSSSPEPISGEPEPLGSIAGVVWHDLCENLDQAETTPVGCRFDASRKLYLANGILESGEPGIGGVEVSIGRGTCPAKGLASAMTDPSGAYQFPNLLPGTYCISVTLGNTVMSKTEPGIWTYPLSDRGEGVSWFSVTIGEALESAVVNFGWDYLLKPSRVKIVSPLDDLGCENRVGFVQDLTIIDGTYLSPSENFDKTWRLKNTGSCTWTNDYRLVFHSGDALENESGVLLGQVVEPGQMIDLSVPLIAPEDPGSYEGYWMLSDPGGDLFGIGENGDKPFWVKIRVGEVWSPTSVVSWDYVLDPEELADEGRWIDVDLSEQIVRAYQESTLVTQFLVSTGTASFPTVTGQFRIWIKLEYDDMRGPGYYLEDVPYTMYFYQGYGLHGTFWHDNFGTPMSHGCVNLRTPDAAWLFDFAGVGTLVNVHP